MAADPSSRVRSNSEFRERLMEKVQVNVTETGKLAQQLLKSSRSHEILTQTIKQFVSQEGALMNSQEQLKHCEKVITDMQKQFGDIQHSLQTVNRISEQLEPPYRSKLRLLCRDMLYVSSSKYSLEAAVTNHRRSTTFDRDDCSYNDHR